MVSRRARSRLVAISSDKVRGRRRCRQRRRAHLALLLVRGEVLLEILALEDRAAAARRAHRAAGLGGGGVLMAFAACRARKGEDARVHALVRSVLKWFPEAPLAPRPEAAARVVLDAVRLGRVRPDQTGRLVGEGAALDGRYTKTVNRYTEIHSVSDSQADTHQIHTHVRAVPSSRNGLLDTVFLKTFSAFVRERDAPMQHRTPWNPNPDRAKRSGAATAPAETRVMD